MMSVNKWNYEPSKCDGRPCIGDCDECNYEESGADIIKVVRCKDCMYFIGGCCVQEDIRYGYVCEYGDVCGDDMTTFEPDEDFWCKYGEKRETE